MNEKKPTYEELEKQVNDLEKENRAFKQVVDGFEKRIVSLTQPLKNDAHIGFEDLFNIDDIQRIQDEFAKATGLASIITHTDGTPITAPSNFCRLCKDIIRKTEKGLLNCFKSDAVIGRFHPGGPVIQKCMSGGLWDAGAGIIVGGRHIANWLIGQVRNGTHTDDEILKYAREIGANEKDVVEAFREVPAMSHEQFEHIAKVLFTLANQLSTTAYQNIQQARFITDRKQVEEELKESESRFKALHNASFGGIAIHDKGVILDCNQGLSKISGYSVDELIGMDGLLLIAESSRAMVMSNILAGYEKPYEAVGVRINGEEYPIRLEARKIPYKGISVRVVEFRDITEQTLAETEREKLQGQLVQAQKMEAIGTLAGGIAHDFNNMLGVILGHTEMALYQISQDQPIYSDLQKIQKAGERSANLVRQLLVFARKQTIAPKVLDLNKTVGSMLTMLRRLISEDINLNWVPGKNLWKVKIDPSQVDQILVNLCVNARDAIVGVGNLTIETGITTFEESYCSHHQGFLPGEYVLLAVSDTGCGMETETLDKIFEPFFTTKGAGNGTGLGLATVYGIVKQNNGFINVYSERDHGTTFRIYLPRYMGTVEQIEREVSVNLPIRGNEIILLVEDDASLLEMGMMMLQRLGYTVLAASSPGESICLAQKHMGKVDLLMTDVVMPEMNGRYLAKKLLSIYPTIKCLFMSGYTANVISHHGILDEGLHFIQKPFTVQQLATKIRKVLDQYE